MLINNGNFNNHANKQTEERHIQLFLTDASPRKKYTNMNNSMSLEDTMAGVSHGFDNDRIKTYSSNYNNRVPVQEISQKTNIKNHIFIPQIRQSTSHSNNMFTGQIEQPNNPNKASVSTNNLKRSAVDVLSLFGGLGDSQSQEVEQIDESEGENKMDVSAFSIHKNSHSDKRTASEIHQHNDSRQTNVNNSIHHQTNKLCQQQKQIHQHHQTANNCNWLHQSNSTHQRSNNNNNNNNKNKEHDLPVEKIEFLQPRETLFNKNHSNHRISGRNNKTSIDVQKEGFRVFINETQKSFSATNSTITAFTKHNICNKTTFRDDDAELLLKDDCKENVHNNDKLTVFGDKENFETEEEDFFTKENEEDDNDTIYKDLDVRIVYSKCVSIL